MNTKDRKRLLWNRCSDYSLPPIDRSHAMDEYIFLSKDYMDRDVFNNIPMFLGDVIDGDYGWGANSNDGFIITVDNGRPISIKSVRFI